jgi:ketosteroid isomerase-like protein
MTIATPNQAEADIRSLMERRVKAMMARDARALFARHATDVVACDFPEQQ